MYIQSVSETFELEVLLAPGTRIDFFDYAMVPWTRNEAKMLSLDFPTILLPHKENATNVLVFYGKVVL